MEPTYTLTEAAKAVGKARVTLRRYLDQGRFPDAFRDESEPNSHPWRIPLTNLRTAGLLGGGDQGPTSGGTEQEAALRTELAVAQALASERARTIELLNTQLSQLQETLREVASR